MLEVKNLEVKRGGETILRNLSWKLKPGAPYGIVGESGSGKTTLLFSLLGLIPISKGEITVCDQNLSQLSRIEIPKLEGIVFQDYQLFPHLTVLGNVKLAPRLLHLETTQIPKVLERLGIAQLAHKYPHELSGGQKQRVAIARSLILKPRILFLDEPSAALDYQTSENLSKLLQELNHETQIVIVSHDQLFLKSCCAEGICLSKGEIIREGKIESLFSPGTT